MNHQAQNRVYEVFNQHAGVPIKSWTVGVPFEPKARDQLERVASLPFVHKWVAAMPDVHLGKGATIGSVIATDGAVIPAAVGVDIGCGMMAVRTNLSASQLPDNLAELRSAIEAAVPHGRTHNGGPGDKGAWSDPPLRQREAWGKLRPDYENIIAKHPRINRSATITQLGTLGTGNHFIEVCLDERERVWFMLHSGSRGVGNRIGTHFIRLARDAMTRWHIHLPDPDLAYLPKGTDLFRDYLQAVDWAQRFARLNRELMMEAVMGAAKAIISPQLLDGTAEVIDCHHNYVAWEHHYGKNVLVTRKGAVRAREGDMGIIPGSMGAQSHIVRGLGNPHSFQSCSHGAGRAMSRTEAKRRFSVEEHARATEGIECRKDIDVLDETPGAYKSIDAVMHAQRDLVQVVHTLRQVIVVKG